MQFLPKNLRQIMRNNETDRSNIEAQLRTRTSLSPVQRVAALASLVQRLLAVPPPFVARGIFQKLRQVPKGCVRGVE